MLRLGKLYIHFLTIAMFIIFFLNRHITELCYAYFSMLLHEGAHLGAAVGIGLRVSHFALYPFGVNLKLKNKLTAGISEEIILYLSGPAMNILIAAAALFFREYIPNSIFLYRANIVLFAVNMLPIMPLDGGCIAEKLLTYSLGGKRAGAIIKGVTAILTALVFALGVYVAAATGYNYSVILLGVFLVGNLFTQRKKYNTEYVRELMFYRNKPLKRVKLSAAYDYENDRDIVKRFIPKNYNIVCKIDKNGRIKELKSEREMIEGILGDKS